MSRQHHYLKIAPRYFRAIATGEKTFEVRFNDRNFQKYDVLHLQEYADDENTGREIVAEVTYVMDNPDFCKEGYVVMAIKVFSIYE